MFKTVLPLSFVLMLAGCASQAPTNYYRLQSRAIEQQPLVLPAKASLGIGPVRFPSTLDYKGLVSDQAQTGVKIASHDLWAGDLDKEFTRVIAESISVRVSGLEVLAEPWDTRFRPEYQLRLDVQRFSGELGLEAKLKLNAILLGDYGKRKIDSYVVDLAIDIDGRSYSAYVESLNSLLAAFADQAAAVFAKQLVSSDKKQALELEQ